MQRVGSALVPEQYADIFKTMNERVVDFFSKQTVRISPAKRPVCANLFVERADCRR